MINLHGNLFSFLGNVDGICITTNGAVKKNGCAVMGRGCAAQAATRWPGIEYTLGQRLMAEGNIPFCLVKDLSWVISFPVKPERVINEGTNVVAHMKHRFEIDAMVPGWAAVADPGVIENSARYLASAVTRIGWNKVVLPRPGCGAGELDWEVVEPILQRHLDDRFVSVTL